MADRMELILKTKADADRLGLVANGSPVPEAIHHALTLILQDTEIASMCFVTGSSYVTEQGAVVSLVFVSPSADSRTEGSGTPPRSA